MLPRRCFCGSLWVAALVLFSCGKPSSPAIGHGSPRPDCTARLPDGRTPYAMPTVLDPGWDTPVKLGDPVNTACPEDAVEISRDGQRLYFMWSSGVNASNDEKLTGSSGTYVAERAGTDPATFGPPTFFELRKGAATGAFDAELSFTPAGDQVFFHSTRAQNLGYQQSPPTDDPMDIYVARIVDGVPESAKNVTTVNSIYRDGEHCLSPDGNTLYLASDRPGGLGGVDLWQSHRVGEAWTTPLHAPSPLSSTADELQPAFAADHPETMYFVSNRDGQTGIYSSTYDGVNWSTPTRLITGYVGEPSLVADGSILYFVHVLVDAQGVFGADVWYVRRK